VFDLRAVFGGPAWVDLLADLAARTEF